MRVMKSRLRSLERGIRSYMYEVHDGVLIHAELNGRGSNQYTDTDVPVAAPG